MSFTLEIDDSRITGSTEIGKRLPQRAEVLTASCPGHAGEVVQGQTEEFEGGGRFLFTLQAPPLKSTATLVVTRDGGIKVFPPYKVKARAAAELTAYFFERRGFSAEIILDTNIPEGRGCGGSTADCSAASLAVAKALGHCLPPEELAAIVCQAEGASDSTMFSRPVIFSHRIGRVREYLAGCLPPIFCVVVDTEPDGEGVNTLELPPANYTVALRQEFKCILGLLRNAIREGNPYYLGLAATRSAQINQEFLAKRFFNTILSLAGKAGAYGVAAAHSGTVLALLLPPQFEGTVQHRELLGALAELELPIIAEYTTILLKEAA